MEQRIITKYTDIDEWIEENKLTKIFLVCDASLRFLRIKDYFDELGKRIRVINFDHFQPNPLYESVVEGVKLFRNQGCDSIIAIGGGSAMDVAKCIKIYATFPGNGENGEWIGQKAEGNAIPFLAMPTTAGTGSEATRYAVIYWKGAKQSITSERFIPKTVLMDPSCLSTLPLYQKKATMCDALCHAIESFWSVNSTDESKECSRRAIQGVLGNMEGYLQNTESGNAGMLRAAHEAGKAINITQTTAGHAMCYKITSLFG